MGFYIFILIVLAYQAKRGEAVYQVWPLSNLLSCTVIDMISQMPLIFRLNEKVPFLFIYTL